MAYSGQNIQRTYAAVLKYWKIVSTIFTMRVISCNGDGEILFPRQRVTGIHSSIFVKMLGAVNVVWVAEQSRLFIMITASAGSAHNSLEAKNKKGFLPWIYYLLFYFSHVSFLPFFFVLPI